MVAASLGPFVRCSKSFEYNLENNPSESTMYFPKRHIGNACHFFYMSIMTSMKSPRRFRASSSRRSRRRAMTPADASELKKYRQRQLLERFRKLGPMPTTGTHMPMLTTAQMMKFNVFQDAKPKRRSKKKARRHGNDRTSYIVDRGAPV